MANVNEFEANLTFANKFNQEFEIREELEEMQAEALIKAYPCLYKINEGAKFFFEIKEVNHLKKSIRISGYLKSKNNLVPCEIVYRRTCGSIVIDSLKIDNFDGICLIRHWELYNFEFQLTAVLLEALTLLPHNITM